MKLPSFLEPLDGTPPQLLGRQRVLAVVLTLTVPFWLCVMGLELWLRPEAVPPLELVAELASLGVLLIGVRVARSPHFLWAVAVCGFLGLVAPHLNAYLSTDPAWVVTHYGFTAVGVLFVSLFAPPRVSVAVAGLYLSLDLIAASRHPSLELHHVVSVLALVFIAAMLGVLNSYFTAQAAYEREALNSRLMLADRLAALGRLVTGMGHELNNPLTYIQTNLEYLERELREDDKSRHGAVVDTLDGVRRMSNIVRELHRFSQESDGPPAAMDLSAALRSALHVASPRLRHQVRVDDDIAEHLYVLGIRGQLEQVFLNLVLNGAQALESVTAADPMLRVFAVQERGEVLVRIEYNGPSLPRDVRENLFDPFFNTKALGEGTVLGLSICQQIVAGHNGSLTLVEPESGRGACFEVRMPASREMPTQEPQPITLDLSPKRALIIDDEPLIATALARSIPELLVTVANDGIEGLEACASQRFDVILCDVIMPRCDGAEFFQRLQQRDLEQSLRVIFMTGSTTSDAASRFVASCDAPLLRKPFDRRSLREAFQKAGLLTSEAKPTGAGAASPPARAG